METSNISSPPVRIKNSFSIENILSKPDKFVPNSVCSSSTSISGVELMCHNENNNFTTQFSHVNGSAISDTNLEVKDLRRHNCLVESEHEGNELCEINIQNGFATPDSSCDDIADTCSDVASEESSCK